MRNFFKNNLVISICLFSIHASGESTGYITGTLLLDEEWERVVYVSKIESIIKEHAVSSNMIMAKSKIDSLGYFTIHLNELQSEWCLLRIHVVKKGDPPASLIIGSMDENYCYVIANRESKIKLCNSVGRPIFKRVAVSGTSYMNTFEHVLRLSEFTNSVNYIDSLIEKQFIEEVIAEKLKLIADTCNNPLVSLYALYKTDFQSDAKIDPSYYESYLAKRENESSSYYLTFRRELQEPDIKAEPWIYLLFTSFISLILIVGYLIFSKKKSKVETLSLQERKVFELLQKGCSNQEIMDELNIGLSTTKSHVSSIFSKMNLKSRKEAMDIKT